MSTNETLDQCRFALLLCTQEQHQDCQKELYYSSINNTLAGVLFTFVAIGVIIGCTCFICYACDDLENRRRRRRDPIDEAARGMVPLQRAAVVAPQTSGDAQQEAARV